MKIVIDSNIFVSSFFWGGNPRKIFDRVIDGLDELFISDELLKEILEVMLRKKFNLELQKAIDYVNIIEQYSFKIIPNNVSEVISRDKDDNKIINCGIMGKVDCIISGDKDLLILKEYNGIKIMNPKSYLDSL